MKKHLITLLALGASVSVTCFGVKLEKRKKGIIIEHQGSVNNTTFNIDANYIFFSLKKDKKYLVEIYDIKKNEIIKTIQDTRGDWSSPTLNNSMPWLVAYGHNLHKENEVPKCSIFNLKESTETTSFASNFFSLNPEFLLTDNLFLMPSVKKARYSLVELKNNKEKTFTFNDDIETCIKSPDKQHLVFDVKNGESYIHDTWTDVVKLLSKNKLTKKAFNPSSTMLSFFDPETKKLVLYRLATYESLKEYSCEKPITNLFFPNHQTVIFSYDDCITYYIWDINEEKPFSIKLDSHNYEHYRNQSQKIHPRYFHFQLWELERCDIYDIISGVLYSIYQNGHGSHLIFNNDDTYAILCTNENVAALYETEDWKHIKSFTFQNGSYNPSAQFSPCGQFAIGLSRGSSDELQIYDIETKTIILSSSWVPWRNSEWIQFYKNNTLIFPSNDTTIMIYNYKKRQKKELKIDGKITQFAVHGDWLTMSSGEQTKLISLEGIELEDCEIPEIKEIIEIQKKETDSVDTKKSDTFTFYDHEGNLVTIKKETKNNSYCTIL